jgi:hypothetical protein
MDSKSVCRRSKRGTRASGLGRWSLPGPAQRGKTKDSVETWEWGMGKLAKGRKSEHEGETGF